MGSFLGGSAPSSQSVYQPTGTAQFDQSYQSLVNSMLGSGNPYNSTASGPATTTFNAAYNNPAAPGYVAAASAASPMLTSTGNTAAAAAPQISTAATGQLLPAVQQTLNTAFDPQSQLYQRTLQQLTDQSNVQNAQSGTTNSPYGASVANNATSNFNIDWQAQQLANQIAGIGAAGSGITNAANAATSANNLGVAGAQDVVNAGAVPYQANQTVTNDQTTALQNLLSVIGNQGAGAWDTNTLNALMSYLGIGLQQGDLQAQINQQAQQNAQSGIGGLLGAGLNAAGNAGGIGDLFSLGGSGAASADIIDDFSAI